MKTTDEQQHKATIKSSPFLLELDWEKDNHKPDYLFSVFYNNEKLTKAGLKALKVGERVRIPMQGILQGETLSFVVALQGKLRGSKDTTILMHDERGDATSE